MRLWRSRRDLADEVDQFYEAAVAEWVAAGISETEARRRARLEFGSTLAVREQVRESGWEHAIETAWADVAYAFRRLRRDRAFTFITTLTLALGIGATTAIFSVVYPVLFAALPYPHPNRIVMVWDTATGGLPIAVTFGTYRELLARTHAFESMAVMRPWQPTVTAGASGAGAAAEPERLDGQRVSAAFFNVLGVAPLIGSTFDATEDLPNGARVAILSHRLWQRRFSGDPAIVGRQLVLDDNAYTIVGVMPATFENVLAPSAEVWSLLQYDPTLPVDGREWGHHLRLVARLARDATADRATQEIAEVAARPIADFARPAWASLSGGMSIRVLQDDVTRGVRPALLAILGAVVLLLSIACVNVTNLLLGRATARRGELAMRSALGAGRLRLMRQLLTESIVLAACGGALGVALAAGGVRALIALSPAGLPRVETIGVDATVLGAAVVLTTLVGLLVGLLPALHASRNLQANVQQISHRLTTEHHTARRVLVVAEVALALMLLVGAGLLVRSVQRVFSIAPGFDPSDVVVMQIQTSGRRFADAAVVNQFFAQVLDAVRAVPGVTSVGFTSLLPLSGDFERYGIRTEFGVFEGSADQSAFRYAVSGDYFSTMRIPVRQGRLLTADDRATGQRVVVISESLARRDFGGGDPIGRRIHVGDPSQPAYTIVGVAGDVKQASLAVEEAAAAYIPASQWVFSDRALWLVVKTTGRAAALAPSLRSAVWSVDRDQPIVRVAAMERLVADSEAERRFAMLLFEAFGLVALVLAAVGLYGVLFAGVSERTREIGVRAALGASRSTIVRGVVGEGMTLTTAGVVIGSGLALAASQVMLTMLFGVTRFDLLTYAGVIAVLMFVSALACALPALRAAWIDPALTLRSE